MRGLEPAASRPPDEHSNRTELHPELGRANIAFHSEMEEGFVELLMKGDWLDQSDYSDDGADNRYGDVEDQIAKG